MAETADSNTANGKSQLLQVDHQDRLVDTAATEETDALLYSVSAGRHGRHIRMRTDGTATAAEAVTGRLQAQHQKQQQLLKGNGINSLAVPLSEIVKLRNSIINREKELLELRQEVTTLKCIERRQQRDLDHYIAEEDKAPRLIKNLREELQSVKEKLREANTQRSAEERKSRQLYEKLAVLAEKTDRYRKLVEHGDFESREILLAKLEEAKKIITEQDQTIKDHYKHMELAQKNFTKEYERGQHKIKVLDAEIESLKQRLEQSDLRIKEKDKKIATLTMFNAQKAEAASAAAEECKSCKKRRKDEEIQKMHDEIHVINNIKIEHITPQSVKLHLVGVPTTKSDNPDDPANFNEIRVVINAPVSSHRSEPLIIERKQRRKPGSSTVEPLLIENLICGEHYTLQTFTVFHGVLSKPSAVQRFIADIPPNMPESPVVSVKNHPPRIEIHVKSPEANEGTLATKFRIYHTNSDNFAESSLLVELPITKASYVYENPSSDVVHAFQVSAVNQLGEGTRSTLSEPCQVEPVPPQPFRPRLTKFNRTTAIAKIQIPRDLPDKYPPVEGYKIIGIHENLADLNDSQQPLPMDQQTAIDIEADSVNDLSQKISGLDPDVSYVFKVAVKNRSGFSQWSPYSEPICLKKLVTTPKAPKFDILTSKSVRISLAEILESTDKTPPKGTIGFKVYASKQRPGTVLSLSQQLDEEQGDNLANSTSDRLDGMKLVGKASFAKKINGSSGQLNGSRGNLANEKVRTLRKSQLLGSSNNLANNGGSPFSALVDGLDEGESYYFAVTLLTVGEEESDRSPVIWVPLAAAIELPPSPRTQRNNNNNNNNNNNTNNAAAIGSTNNLTSGGSEEPQRASMNRLNSFGDKLGGAPRQDTLGSLQKLSGLTKTAGRGAGKPPASKSSATSALKSTSGTATASVDKKNGFVVEDVTTKRRQSLPGNTSQATVGGAKKK